MLYVMRETHPAQAAGLPGIVVRKSRDGAETISSAKRQVVRSVRRRRDWASDVVDEG